jgi:hypothetical protein
MHPHGKCLRSRCILDLSIFLSRDGFGLDRKNQLFRVKKILLTTVPLDAAGLNFQAGPGLGRAAHAFCSV